MYQHDCLKCRYLGTVKNADNVETDLYHCLQKGLGIPTIIARHSDDGPDYESIPVRMLTEQVSQSQYFDAYPELFVGLIMARARGYV